MNLTMRHHTPHLAVVESKVSKDGIDRELRKIDPHLFLDAEWDAEFGRLVYAVKVHVAADRAPLLLTDWREPGTRRPLDLSSGLLGKVGRLASERGVDRLKEVAEHNQAIKDYHDRQHDEARADMVVDMVPRMKGTKSTIMPRAQSAAGPAARRQARRDLERRLGIR